jgi:hypothetical protein
MNKYIISYWKETNDEKDCFERETLAENIYDALNEFRTKNPFTKVDSIKLVSDEKFNFSIDNTEAND